MEFNDRVKNYKYYADKLEVSQSVLAEKKKKFEEENDILIKEIADYKQSLASEKEMIELDARLKFTETKEKKFFGGIAIKEYTTIAYDDKKVLEWAKEKDMFLLLDKKAFESVAEGLNLDFVKIDKNPKVTFPKVIKLEG